MYVLCMYVEQHERCTHTYMYVQLPYRNDTKQHTCRIFTITNDVYYEVLKICVENNAAVGVGRFRPHWCIILLPGIICMYIMLCTYEVPS